MKHFTKKALFTSVILLSSLSAFAQCPEPSSQCPANGSSLNDALQCGWTELFGQGSVSDPLQYVSGPTIRGGTSYCSYVGPSGPGIGMLVHPLSTPKKPTE